MLATAGFAGILGASLLCAPYICPAHVAHAANIPVPSGEELSDPGKVMSPVGEQPVCNDSGITFKWITVPHATRYNIYRKEHGEAERLIATVRGKGIVAFTDDDVYAGKTYRYKITALNTLYESASALKLKCSIPPLENIANVKMQHGAKKSTIVWSRPDVYDAVEVQYASNGLFRSKATSGWLKKGAGSYTVPKKESDKDYCARVRFKKRIGKHNNYSQWTLSSNIQGAKKYSTSVLTCRVAVKVKAKPKKGDAKQAKDAVKKRTKKTVKYKTIAFELRKRAKQKLYGYDTLQGATSAGGYIYCALYNRNLEKCKIVKVKRAGMKVVKVSGKLNIDHANDMTYNRKSGRLVVANSSVHGNRLSVVSAKTLKVKRQVYLKFPSKLEGASSKQASAMKGVTAISYDARTGGYVAVLKGSHNLLFLNAKFKPVRYANVEKPVDQIVQCAVASGDYILVCEAAERSAQWNRITVFDRNGTYVRRLLLRGGLELENAFFVGNSLHVGYYQSSAPSVSSSKNVWKTVRRNYFHVLGTY